MSAPLMSKPMNAQKTAPYEITINGYDGRVTSVEHINGHTIESGWRMTDSVRSTGFVHVNGVNWAESYYDISPHLERARNYATKNKLKEASNDN